MISEILNVYQHALTGKFKHSSAARPGSGYAGLFILQVLVKLAAYWWRLDEG